MLVFNSNILKVNGSWLTPKINYNPLNLPPKTIRVQYAEGVTPTVGDSQTLVDAENNIWDITKNSTSWNQLFYHQESLVGILGANSEGVTSLARFCEQTSSANGQLRYIALFDTSAVTDIGYAFQFCRLLTDVPFFDLSNVTAASGVFSYCQSLEHLPNFDLSSSNRIAEFCYACSALKQIPDLKFTTALTRTAYAFRWCYQVESGILDMYNKLSGLGSVTEHSQTFFQCGRDTVTGSAELAQIPDDWK